MQPMIVGLFHQAGICEYYRVVLPFSFLRRNGWDARWHTYMEWAKLCEGGIRMPEIVVFPRLDFGGELGPAISTFEKVIGAHKTVYETDDDLTNRYRKVAHQPTREFACRCDLITVTTPHLRKVMNYLGPPVEILPNCINMNLTTRWIDEPRVESITTIALTGSPSHYKDWQQVETALRTLSRDRRIHIIVAGFIPDYLKGMSNTTYREKFLPYEQYLRLVWEADIVLCPLDAEDGFNLSKSAIKAIEGLSLARRLGNKIGGAVPICSDYPVYRRVVSNNHNGLLVKPDGWYEAILRLVEDQQCRRRLAVVGHAWVRKHRDMTTQWKQWDRVYKGLL